MFREYFKALYRFSPRRLFGSLLLFILLGFTQGVGLMMLLPLLQGLGVPGGGDPSGVLRLVSTVFQKPGQPVPLLSILSAYAVLVSAFALAKGYQTVLNAKIRQSFVLSLQNRLYAALARAEWLFLVQRKASDLAHAVTADMEKIASGTYYLLQFLGIALLVAFHLVIAGLLSWKLTGLTLIFAAALFFLIRPLTRRSYTAGKSLRASEQNQYSTIMEHLAGMKTAKSFGAEQPLLNQFQQNTCQIKRDIVDFTKVRANIQAIFEISSVLMLCLFLGFATQVLRIPLADLLILAFIFVRILPKFAQMVQNYQFIANMLPAYSGMESLLKTASESQEPSIREEDPCYRLQHSIELQDLSFDYPEPRGRPALHRVSFVIPARKITAVVGHSGAGKSTMADILLGLLKPSEGRLLVDGEEISPDRIHSWRRCVAYVPQETFLFHDTIRANLMWADPHASETQLKEALEMAEAEDFMQRMPRGLDTIVGDRGIGLSGGERQRLALARALLRRPRLLLLDEATSSLDLLSERRIQEAVGRLRGKITIVVIAHRLSTFRQADLVVVLNKGRVIETGPHRALARDSNSAFYRLLMEGEEVESPFFSIKKE